MEFYAYMSKGKEKRPKGLLDVLFALIVLGVIVYIGFYKWIQSHLTLVIAGFAGIAAVLVLIPFIVKHIKRRR
ncbi:MAG: hypothetical protein K6F84_01760, partial [Lachnospiraceae bacterium]|nr:hypothetical protein [Lachnospiraceae bacterium]